MTDIALIAAHQAADAVAALLLHFEEQEGFGDLDVVAKLAEATVHAIDIHARAVEKCDLEYRTALGELREACARHIEGWSG